MSQFGDGTIAQEILETCEAWPNSEKPTVEIVEALLAVLGYFISLLKEA